MTHLPARLSHAHPPTHSPRPAWLPRPRPASTPRPTSTPRLHAPPPWALALTLKATVHLPASPQSRGPTRDSPMPQSLLKLFILANPKPAYPASPVPSHRKNNKGSCPCFPSCLSDPGAAPCGPYGVGVLGSSEYNRLSSH